MRRASIYPDRVDPDTRSLRSLLRDDKGERPAPHSGSDDPPPVTAVELGVA
jgi:hypothetical protein